MGHGIRRAAVSDPMTAPSSTAIPVTVVGGYLGAGKTSLLNHLLTHAGSERVAVLVNDFGELGIDAALIAHQSTETIALTNGCVCCTIADDLGNALDAQVRSGDPPARMVVEASGVADPSKIARYAVGWPGTRLDAVVTVVDLECVRTLSTDRFVGELVRRQIESADVLIANKSDRVSAPALDATVEWLAQVAPRAALLESCHGRVAPAVVLGLNTDSVNADRSSTPAAGGAFDIESPFVRATCRTDRILDRSRLAAALDELPPAVVRFKGFVRLNDCPQRLHVLQGVGRRWTLEPAPTEVAVPENCVGCAIDLIGIGSVAELQSAARALASLP